MNIFLLLFSLTNFLNSAELKDTGITVYNDNRAVVNQKYTADCKKGFIDIDIPNLPRTVVTDSINIDLPQDLRLRFNSYKSENDSKINQNVSVITKDNEKINGVLYRIGDKNITLKNDNDEYLIIENDYIKYINYGKFDETDFKNRMINNGTLNISLDSKKSGKCDFMLNYIINNLSWQAAYDAYVDESFSNLDINARVNLTNNSGYNFKNSKISLVAGVVNKASDDQPQTFRLMAAKSMDFGGNSEEMTPKSLSEFYAYDLPVKDITINDSESISVDIFTVKNIKFDKVYIYKGQKDNWYYYDNLKNYKYDKNLTAQLIFKNTKENNLNKPLPEGKIRVYQKNGDLISLVGEDNLPHTAVNDKVEINTGKAFDVSGERKIIEHKKVMTNVYRDTINIKIKNEKNEPINVKIKEYLWGNSKIIDSSSKYNRIDANNIEFDIKVEKKSTFDLNFTAEYNFNQ
jgi:hypothetical protein